VNEERDRLATAPFPVPRRTRWLVYVQVLGIVLAAGLVAVNALRRDPAAPARPGTPAAAEPTAAVAPKPVAALGTPSLPPFEQRQLTMNRALFSGELADFAATWLAKVSDCASSRDERGPVLREGEQTRIVCWHGNVAVYFIAYRSAADRDRVRARVMGDHTVAQQLAPGATGPVDWVASSGNSHGTYVEYAYDIDQGSPTKRTVCGAWWDSVGANVAGYLLAYWRDDLGESWEPLRDVWRRNT
jgi:hypothetical protein